MRASQYILILFFLVSAYCTGQEAYYTRWYSADNNYLPQNSVKSITPDKYGFIWLSTESGLIRFDGKNFKTFNSSNIDGLISDRMFLFGGSVEKDSITIRNETQQFLVIHKRSVRIDTTTYVPPVKINNWQFKWALECKPGLHHTKEKDFFRLNSGKNTAHIIGNDSVRIYDLKYNLKEKFAFPLTSGLQFFGISGKLYLMGNGNKYYHITKNDSTAFRFNTPTSASNKIYTNENSNQVFLVSDKNLYLVKEKKGLLYTELIYNDFNFGYNIKSIYYNEENKNLYLGSSNKGLLVVKPREFMVTGSPFKMNRGVDGVYYGLIPFKGDKVLASTGSIFKDGNYTGNIPIGAENDKYTIIIDDNEDIWVKGFINLYQYKKASGYKDYSHWKLDNYITTMAKSPDGKIWIGTLTTSDPRKSGSLYMIDPSAEKVQPKLYKKLENGPSAIYSINENELWIGSSNGLIKMNIKDNTFEDIPGFKNAFIRAILVEENNMLWIATYTKGLFLYNNGKLTKFPIDKNKYLLSSHCIVEDNQGYFWIPTNRGLFRMSKKDLMEYAAGERKSVYYYYYNKDHGFATNEFNGGCKPCGVYLNNLIYFPSMDGIVYFNPDKVPIEKPDSEIFIDEAEVDTTITSTSDLKLHRKFGKVTFFVTSPFFGNPYNQNIETQLKGPVSQNWTSLTDNYVAFSTLPPGKYTLTARKLTGSDSNYIYKRINFTVIPAFWQTLWFKVLIAVIGSIILLLLFKMRLRYIQYRNVILERKVALQTAQLHNTISTLRKTKDNLSAQNESHKKLIKTIIHDIKTPLKFMAITGRYVYNSLDDKDETLKEDVESIYTSSSQLYAFIDEFLEYSKQVDRNTPTPPFSLKELVNEKIDFFKTLASHKDIELINYIEDTITVNANKHLLSIVIHNLLDNALKNTQNGGSIVFNATLNRFEETILSVKDNGIGMSKEQTKAYNEMITESFNDKSQTIQSVGIGLQIIVELLIIMDAKMVINSTEGIGTEVKITLR